MTTNEPENNQQQENEPTQEPENWQQQQLKTEKQNKSDFFTGLAFGIGVILSLGTVIIPIALIIFAYREGKGKPEVLKGFIFGALLTIIVLVGSCFIILGSMKII